jgi:RHS repeat-associated protein
MLSGNLTSIHGPATLPETGTYTIRLIGSGEATGSVKLTAYTFEDVTGSIAPTAEGAGKSVSITTPGQRAFYSVEVEAGDSVSVKTSNASFSSESRYYLYWRNSEGGYVNSNWWWGKTGSGWWGRQEFTKAGTYTLEVDPEGTMTGSVDLTLWDATDKTGDTITPSEEGGSGTYSVDVPGQRELITFAGTEGQQVSIVPSEASFSGSFEVFKPGGGSMLSGNLTSIHGPATLPETGTYTIRLIGSGEATGSVKLTAYDEGFVAYQAPETDTYQLVSWTTEEADTTEVSYSDLSGDPSDERTENPFDIGSNDGGDIKSSEEPPVRSLDLDSWTPKNRTWLPPEDSYERGWIAGRSSSPWLDLAPLYASKGTSALSGQVLQVNGLPLSGVRVAIEGTSLEAETDDTGRFLLRQMPPGQQILSVDGESTRGSDRYGTFTIRVNVTPDETTELEAPIWMTPLDQAGDHSIGAPTEHEVRLKNDRIPGFEVRIPEGTKITGAEGQPVKDLNITAIPVDRPAFPLPPFLSVPVYFTVQPGGASFSKGVQVIYPNWGDLPPGKRVEFWNYSPEDGGWYVYGKGAVSPDGKQVVPDPGVRVWELTGAMAAGPPAPPGTGPNSSGGADGGDPVDFYTGLFTYQKTDLKLPDSIPLTVERSYRPNDSNSYSFGQGTSSLFDMRLWSVNTADEADLILPDGGRVHYVRSYAGGPFETETSPSVFSSSTITWNETTGTWDLALTNGTTFRFNPFNWAPLVAIRDRFGNTLSIKRAAGLPGNVAKVTTPHGRWAEFSYDGSNRITEVTDNAGRALKYTYASGRLTKVEASGERTTEYEYDESGRMKAIINARGNKYLQNAYDANGRVEKQTTGDGGTFEFAYETDEEGNVEATTITDPRGNQRKVEFDAEGLPVAETEAPGTELAQTTSFERQPETGLILSETDPLERKTEFEYDSVGNLTEVTKLAGTEDAVTTKLAYEPGTSLPTEVTDALGHTTEFEYGEDGELLTRTDALENETTFKYNDDGQPTSITNPAEEATTFGYEHGDLASVTDPLGRTTRQFTDALGRVRSITSPAGERTLLFYNEADEPTAITSPSGAQTTIGYDKDGNVSSVTDPRENTTTMAYDVMDRLDAETNPLEDTAERSYDKAGNLVEAVSRKGEVSQFSYDALGRLAKASFGVEGESTESTIEYEYDDADRLVGVDDSASGEYVLGYDELDRLTEVSGPTGTVAYLYDDAGRRAFMSLPGQEPLEYEYDDANRLTGLSRPGEAVALGYDDAGRLTSVLLPDGIEQAYGHDEAGQTTSITYKDGESTLGDLQYAYDADGRTKAIWGSYARLDLPEAMESAKYNVANELVERDEEELSYDKDGNLTKDGTSEYEWDARGQLSAITGGSSASFGYDAFGRRVSKTLGEATTDLLYDDANVVQEYSGEELAATVLTGLKPDQLFSRTTGEGTDSILADRLGSVIALADGSGEVATTYSYEPFGSSSETGDPSDSPFQFTGREDDGTGLMYYRARYYSPSTARFISPDPAGFSGSGSNPYWYANGNPLYFTDPTGECPYPPESCIPSIPSPAEPIKDLLHGAGENLQESGRQIGEWASDAPGVASDAGDFLLGGLTAAEAKRLAISETLSAALCRFATRVASRSPDRRVWAAAGATCLGGQTESAWNLGWNASDDD